MLSPCSSASKASWRSIPGQFARACVELAKDWRQDKYLRRLEAMMAVADKQIEFHPDRIGRRAGAGGRPHRHRLGRIFALSAARALVDIDGMTAEAIAKKAMKIAADICIYTNHTVIFEKL